MEDLLLDNQKYSAPSLYPIFQHSYQQRRGQSPTQPCSAFRTPLPALQTGCTLRLGHLNIYRGPQMPLDDIAFVRFPIKRGRLLLCCVITNVSVERRYSGHAAADDTKRNLGVPRRLLQSWFPMRAVSRQPTTKVSRDKRSRSGRCSMIER